MRSLDEKVFAITGASRGIGAATARLLAREGCRLALGGRDAAALAEVVRDVSEAGGEASAVECDVRRYEDCERLVSEAVDRFGGLDGFVANAGVGAYGELLDLSLEQIDDMLDSNARGTDRKSTRLNSSHANISYAVFCLKKKIQLNAYDHFLFCAYFP